MMIVIIPKEDYPKYRSVLPEDVTGREGLMIGAFNGSSLEGILFAEPVGNKKWNISHLFVIPDERRKGIGSGLITKCRDELISRGAHALTTDHYSENGEGTDVVNEFLSVSGFLVQRRTRVLQTTLDALSEGAKRFKKRSRECEILPLSEMEDGLWENLPQYFSEARINRHEGDTDAFLYPKTFYHQEISRYIVNKEKEIKAILLVHINGDSISADYLWCDDSLGIAMVGIISDSVREALSFYPGHTNVTCHMMNPAAGRIVEKLALKKICYIGTLTEYISVLH